MTAIPQPLRPASGSSDLHADYVFGFGVTQTTFEAAAGFLPDGQIALVYTTDGGDPIAALGLYVLTSGVWVFLTDLWDGDHAHALVSVDTIVTDGSFTTMPGPWLYEVFDNTPANFPQGLMAGRPAVPTRVDNVTGDNGWPDTELWRRAGRYQLEGSVAVGTLTAGTQINSPAIDASFRPSADTPFTAVCVNGAVFTTGYFVATSAGFIKVAQVDLATTTVTFGDGSWTHP